MVQSLISKYVWVIDIIYRSGKILFKELNQRWLDDEISKGVDIPKHTFNNWIYAIQNSSDYSLRMVSVHGYTTHFVRAMCRSIAKALKTVF